MSRRSFGPLLLLTLAAVAVNLHPPQPFFDQQLMLGTSLAVLALLRFGWPGLVVGLAAYSVTWTSWGHAFELINGTGWLLSLQLFLSRCNGGSSQRANGRLVLATVAYWLVIGLPAEWLWFRFGMGLNALAAFSLGLKELVTAVLNASLGLMLEQGLQLLDPRQRRRGLQIRGLTFSSLLLAITIPGLLMILLLTRELNTQALRTQQAAMQSLGQDIARIQRLGAVPPPLAGVAVRVLDQGRERFNSDPGLFQRLGHAYRRDRRRSPQLAGLVLLEPRRPMPVLEANRQAYWLTQLSDGSRQITVVQPAAALIQALDFDLLLPCFSLMAVLLIGATLISEAGGSLLDRQFGHILRVAQPRAAGSDPRGQAPSFIRELNRLAQAIRFATRRLEDSNTRYRNFFNLPLVGTAITSVHQGWVEVNDETCRLLGYSREELFRLTWAELTHPDDLAADEAQFRRMLRREIDGYELEKRFIRKDGTVVHTLLAGGCGPIGDQPVDLCYVNLIDISPRKQVEADLAALQERERRGLERQRRLLEQKLKTSLTAAAIAHEIQQPLAAILLRCGLALQSLAAGASTAETKDLEEELRALSDDAQRVVSTMERMRMLLRNVETPHSRVDLAVSINSALVFLRGEIEARGVTLSEEGLDLACPLLGDGAQLQTAVVNLIRNALQAMEPQPAGSRRLQLQLQRDPDHVRVVVADSGPGFPEHFRNDTSWEVLKSTKVNGMGLGLFLAQTAAVNHHGQLRIGRSERLGGAEVVIELPRSEALS